MFDRLRFRRNFSAESDSDVSDLEDFESRLRDSLTAVATPIGLPTIGVRERIVSAVHHRRQKRLRVASGFAACCIVVAGVATGIAVTHGSPGSGNYARSASPAVSPSPAPAVAPANHSSPRTSVNGPSATSTNAKGSQANPGHAKDSLTCAQVTIGGGAAQGCFGVYSPVAQGDQGLAQPPANGVGTSPSGAPSSNSASTTTTVVVNSPSQGPSTSAPTGKAYSSTDSNGGTSQRVQVIVPLGTPIRVMLPGTSGEIWTAPVVAPGQGTSASQVQLKALTVNGAGKNTYATLESSVPVTVEIEASAIPVCGATDSPCGTATTVWTLILEFQSS
jgi:hypothetical protein